MPDELRYFDAQGVDCLTATLHRHRYTPHAHAEFVIGAKHPGELGLQVIAPSV